MFILLMINVSIRLNSPLTTSSMDNNIPINTDMPIIIDYFVRLLFLHTLLSQNESKLTDPCRHERWTNNKLLFSSGEGGQEQHIPQHNY